MQTHFQELSQMIHSVTDHKSIELEEKQTDVETIIKMVKRLKKIDTKTTMLEIGTGGGWFEIFCEKQGISCKGLEIDPQYIEYAKQFGRKYGLEPNIQLGNIEETDI